jgi:hypothetical protein
MIKRLFTTLSLLLFVITCCLFIWYRYQYSAIVPIYQKKLSGMADDRSREINSYLNQQEKNAVQLSQEAAVIDILTSNTSEQQAVLDLLFLHKEAMGFKNIMVIDAQAQVRFSTAQKNLVGENVSKHTNSSFGKSYERAMMTLTNDFSQFNFNELLQEPALFITVPIIHQKKFIGALSYQLDEEKIYLITNQYIGLGKTGEVVLARKEGEYAVFLSATRTDPDLAFKKTMLFTDHVIDIDEAVLGKQGSGKAIDYRGEKVVSVWKFIPKLDWGMVVKIDQAEIFEHTDLLYFFLLLFLLLFLGSLLPGIYFFYPVIKKKYYQINSLPPFTYIPPFAKNPFFILFILFLGLTVHIIMKCERKKSSTLEKAKQQAIKITTKNAEGIESALEKIVFTAGAIADDFRTNYLKKDDITTRITRDAAENNMITDISVLFSPYSYDGETEVHLLSAAQNNLEGLSDQVNSRNIFKTKWYTQALEKGSTWIINSSEEPQKKNDQTAIYARSILDAQNKPVAVVAITFLLSTIIHAAEYNSVGQTGYSIIMNPEGAFIFHPITALVKNETTLLQYAQSQGNEELAVIAQKTMERKPLLDSYAAQATKEHFWIYTHPIKINNWIVGSIFSEEEVDLSSKTIRHYYFWTLIFATITVLLFGAFLCACALFSLTWYAIAANVILLFALALAWRTIQKTTTSNRETTTIITDQSRLNKFLNDLKEEADRKHEAPPITIPCGILLYSLSILDADYISISGYLWNKYDTKLHGEVQQGIDLPQASKLTFGQPLTVQSGDTETVTISVQGSLFQEQNYAQYPFDQQHTRIILEHRDIEKNIVLTPDLTAYKKISPESTPGLDKEFSLPGFTIEQTFFEYHQIDPNANFGFKEYGKVTDHFQLIYNAIMTRNLLNPFVLYVLPLLVILFSLFSTLLVAGAKTDPLSILGGYTGLFFALVVLQRSLREQHPAGTTLYMEYAFFYTYVTIIFLIIHTILMYYYKHWEHYQKNSLYLLRILFWPFQLISWLITTLIVFY